MSLSGSPLQLQHMIEMLHLSLNQVVLGAAGATTLSPMSMTTIAHGLRTTGATQPGVMATALPVGAMQMRTGGDGDPCRHATIGGLHRRMRGGTTGAARAHLPGTTLTGACPLTGRSPGSTRSGDPQQTVTLTGFSSDHPHPRQVRQKLPAWPTGLKLHAWLVKEEAGGTPHQCSSALILGASSLMGQPAPCSAANALLCMALGLS